MIDAKRITELREWLQGHVDDLKLIEKEAKKARGKLVTPIRMDLLVGPYYADLLLILDRYEAALLLIEAAMGITLRDHYLIEGVAQGVEKLVDAALKLREKEGKK
jgi:hypothetical protein